MKKDISDQEIMDKEIFESAERELKSIQKETDRMRAELTKFTNEYLNGLDLLENRMKALLNKIMLAKGMGIQKH